MCSLAVRKSSDGSPGPGLLLCERSRMAAGWKLQKIRATTLICAKKKERRQGRIFLYSLHRTGGGAGGRARLHPRTGRGDLATGRKLLIDNAETAAAMTRAATKALGLKLFPPVRPVRR